MVEHEPGASDRLLLFERLAASRNKESVLALGRRGLGVSKPSDVIKDPFVLEVLDLSERPGWLEAHAYNFWARF